MRRSQVITWHPADALEQSEACRQSQKTKRRLSSHPARHSLAYIASVPTRRVSKADAELATDSDSLTYVSKISQ
ncbi:MAG: DUF1589 domain-containing protein [bacterium]|nr:DUF1589 domain-containing protein [bacterium]